MNRHGRCAADGEGYSLVLIDPSANPDHNNAANWRSSIGLHGNPGAVKTTLDFDSWKLAHGIVDDLGDPDRDGLTNLMEYALGTLPATPLNRGSAGRGGQPFTVGLTSG